MRDIILFIGPFASGKTYTLNFFKDWTVKNDIPVEPEVLTDSKTIINSMEKDDATGGFYHYHSWCIGNIWGHTHDHGEPKLPMIAYGNKVLDGMYHDLFEQFEKLPFTGKYWLAEFAGGTNVNKPDTLEYFMNYSLLRLAKMIERGFFPNHWLHRVYGVIHPETSFATRIALNTKKNSSSTYEIKKGLVSAFNIDTVMRVTGEDDFHELEKLFVRKGVNQIYSIKNTGDTLYNKTLDGVARKLFTTPIFTQRKEEKRDIVLVVGQNAAGKKTVLHLLYQYLKAQKIPFNERLHSDFSIFLRKVREDDLQGGLRHYHEWTTEKSGGHVHTAANIEIPFIITEYDIFKDSYGDYFAELNNLPYNGKLWLVEWSGGINGNPSYEPASQIDVSFETIGKYFGKGIYSTDWFRRVKAIIHPMAPNNLRLELDETEAIATFEKINQDFISPGKKNLTILDMYKKDDFFAVEKYFHEARVPLMHHFAYNSKEKLVHHTEYLSTMLQ